MSRSTDWIFDTDIGSGRIFINEKHKESVTKLFESLMREISLYRREENILLSYWTYRLAKDTVNHVLDFMTLSDDLIYALTLTEGDEIHFCPYSFLSKEGEITLIDAVDVNGLIHYLNNQFCEKKIKLIFSFSNMNK